ncbi:MAG: tyrosine-type recombinase/integrase, partial [Planctomycetota bacterium]
NLGDERSRSRYIKDHALGDKLVRDIQRADAARWAEDLLRGDLDDKPKNPKTVNRSISFASKAWRYGQDHGHAPEDRNPFRQVERHPETAIDKDPLTPAEVEALIEHADGRLQPLLLAGLHTGARAGELMSLTWADVDLKAGHLTIRASRAKTKHGRQVPLTTELKAALHHLKAAKGIHRHPASLVFTREDGRAWTHKTKDQALRRALARCKDKEIPAHKRARFTFKGLRDSTITALLEKGVPWPVVGRIVGHGSPQTTMRYLGAMMDAQRKALARLTEHRVSDKVSKAQDGSGG